ncbi:MAG: CHC2 zinc finger domain-containing protein [Moraxella sp.]|nr:CHC2 zinc finger domain-containing protein [Moraxella sp.]
MRIPESVIAQINDKADLVAIIRRHTELKPAGREFRGCCPFHGEKTPSFYVNPESNLYYCFGCGAKGNAISFLVDFERLTFVEAVKELANKTGIDLPKEDTTHISYKRSNTRQSSDSSKHKHQNRNSQSSVQSSPTQKNHTQNSRIQSNNEYPQNTSINPEIPTSTSSFVPNALPSSPQQTQDGINGRENATAHHQHQTPFDSIPLDSMPFDTPYNEPYPDYYQKDYFAYQSHDERQFDDSLDNAQGNLYALLKAVSAFYQTMLSEHRAAMDYFVNRGVSMQSIAHFELGYAPMGWQHLESAFPNDIEGLKILGLVRPSQKGRDYDLFRDRVIFPIKDKQGRIVGFAGRAMSDDVMPKYINSSDSVIFQKQHILYGYYESRQAKATDWLMVEGYMDVIALHQAGIFGAVAPMGTAANQGQIETLLKFNNELTLCFDGDKAGQKAAMRTLEIAMPALPDGKTLKFLTLKDNHDPDSFIKAHGAGAMRQAIHDALSISDYLYQVMSAKHELSKPEQKATAMAEIKAITAHLPKGSSFRSLLNNDMYGRLSARRKSTPQQVVSDSKITTLEELYLCILYAPSLVADDVLLRIYHDSGVSSADAPFIERLQASNLAAPALPNWQAIDEHLSILITTVHQSLPYLLSAGGELKTIDANAHFILSALGGSALQQRLAQIWRDFFHHLQYHDIKQVGLLFDELLCQVLIQHFINAQKHSESLLISRIYRAREIALDAWDRRTTKAQVRRLFEHQASI